jgi:hypothetical protein
VSVGLSGSSLTGETLTKKILALALEDYTKRIGDLPNEHYKNKENLSIPATRMTIKLFYDTCLNEEIVTKDNFEQIQATIDALGEVTHNQVKSEQAKYLAATFSEKAVPEDDPKILAMIMGAKG